MRINSAIAVFRCSAEATGLLITIIIWGFRRIYTCIKMVWNIACSRVNCNRINRVLAVKPFIRNRYGKYVFIVWKLFQIISAIRTVMIILYTLNISIIKCKRSCKILNLFACFTAYKRNTAILIDNRRTAICFKHRFKSISFNSAVKRNDFLYSVNLRKIFQQCIFPK